MSTVAPTSTARLIERYQSTREFTAKICEPLEVEDCVIQSMPDVSPTRWHLAHTTWFFETFILKPYRDNYVSSNDAFEYLFNSYYNTVGKQFPRSQRGLLSRPTVKDVWHYRNQVDDAMVELLAAGTHEDLRAVVEIGLQHEQQHQELMLTDIKHVLSCNPLYPQYADKSIPSNAVNEAGWIPFTGGVRSIGFQDDENGFCFDNELPVHEALLRDYSLQNRLVTNREYLAFIDDGGYLKPESWLSMGWGAVQENEWSAPLYWIRKDDGWFEFTLSGVRPLDLDAPVCHVSYFEADAYARWSGNRLPTEFEWENAASGVEIDGNFADSLTFHPVAASDSGASNSAGATPKQLFGDVWEWTSSAYAAYPGYQPPSGALGEYNGKFMCNQFVLRGGSCATSHSHIRPTYRNFFPPEARWQFSGIRLAK